MTDSQRWPADATIQAEIKRMLALELIYKHARLAKAGY